MGLRQKAGTRRYAGTRKGSKMIRNLKALGLGFLAALAMWRLRRPTR
jgi:hypothetical protein